MFIHVEGIQQMAAKVANLVLLKSEDSWNKYAEMGERELEKCDDGFYE